MKIKLLSELYKNGTLKPPFYATEEAAGIDLPACIDGDITLQPMERMLIPTGIAAEIPKGYAGMIYARSGLAIKHGITMVNAVGVVDSDYRGEIKCAVINLGGEPYTIHQGDRVAQMVIMAAPQEPIEIVDEINQTKRGEGGFGSTGKKNNGC